MPVQIKTTWADYGNQGYSPSGARGTASVRVLVAGVIFESRGEKTRKEADALADKFIARLERLRRTSPQDCDEHIVEALRSSPAWREDNGSFSFAAPDYKDPVHNPPVF